MLIRRTIGAGIAMGLTALAITPVVVTGIERLQAQKTSEIEPLNPINPLKPTQHMRVNPSQRSSVLFFSRSGNTALLARYLAKRLNAGLYQIDAHDYALGLQGWANALRDAQSKTADIFMHGIDLSENMSQSETIYLSSPIWMFSPAPPIWQFVASHRFVGKKVVLVNTFNSRFKAEFIDAFRQLVLMNGARSFEHQFVRRGRMGWQLSPQEMLDTFSAHWHI